MIDYVEIRSADTRELIGIIDTAKSIIWHEMYFGVGDFEIYAPCTPAIMGLLSVGNYVSRETYRNIGIIESVNVTYSPQDGRMIVASGRMAKSILDRRIIYNLVATNSVSPTILRGNVESAARKLVTDNAINCTFDTGRNIEHLALGTSAGTTAIIVDETGAAAEKQVTYDNLLDYTDKFLAEYNLGAYCGLNASGKLVYTVFEGADRSVDNAAGNEPVIFSQDFDNLLSSDYVYNETALKNASLVGGEGEGTERFVSFVNDNASTGAARREMFIDAKSTSKTYKDAEGTEKIMTDAEYDAQLKTIGMQETAARAIVETFDGEIDLVNGAFTLGSHFDLGDVVTLQDVEIGLYINARLLETTEVQDDGGYSVTGKFGN